MDSEQASVRFNGEEARAKLRSRVRSLVARDGIAAGTSGSVMQVDEIENDGFELIIEWDSRIDGKRQHDWFNSFVAKTPGDHTSIRRNICRQGSRVRRIAKRGLLLLKRAGRYRRQLLYSTGLHPPETLTASPWTRIEYSERECPVNVRSRTATEKRFRTACEFDPTTGRRVPFAPGYSRSHVLSELTLCP